MAWQTNIQKLEEWQWYYFIKVDDKIKKHELAMLTPKKLSLIAAQMILFCVAF